MAKSEILKWYSKKNYLTQKTVVEEKGIKKT